jgi:hypothetical protein
MSVTAVESADPDSEGWNHLEHRLDALDAAGEDVTERLRGAVTQR